MADDWMLAYAVDASSLGIIAASYYYAYAGMQVPLGLLMDKLGPRRLLALAGLVCAIGCLLMASTRILWLASIGRFLIGMGAACGFLGTMKVATLWFHPSKIGMIAGLSTAIGTIGGITGQAPLSMLNEVIGLKGSLVVLTAAGVMVGAIIWLCVRDLPEKNQEKDEELTVSLLEGLSSVLFNPQAWLIAFHGFLMYVPLAAVADLWGIPFLKSAYGMEEKYAAIMVSFIYIGVIVGGFLLGKFTELFRRKRTPMLIGALASLCCYSAIFFIHPLPEWLIYGLLFLGGVFFSTECLCFAAVCEHLPRQYGGIAVGFTNMIVMMSGVLLQPLIGWLLNVNWDGQMHGNIPYYSLEAFQKALWIVPVCLLLAACVLFFIKEKRSELVHG